MIYINLFGQMEFFTTLDFKWMDENGLPSKNVAPKVSKCTDCPLTNSETDN